MQSYDFDPKLKSDTYWPRLKKEMTLPSMRPFSWDSNFARSTPVLTLTLLFVLSLTSLTFATSTPERYHDYCIVGSGPSGLQLGYFLERANRDYMIFERSNSSGSFFLHYPRHRTLISINKRHTGSSNKEFNLRHDWNSLLSDDESLLFTKYSKDMFPHADRLVDYFRDYQRKFKLRVQFNTEVSDIHNVINVSSPDGVLHVFADQHGQHYHCKVLVLATGMWKPNIPNINGIELAEGYENVSVDPEDYEGKAVMVLGHGNSAFEVAQGIHGSTSFLHVYGRSRVRLAFQTHYVGDIRAVNVGVLDTYQLKSLDGVSEGNTMTRYRQLQRSPDGKLVFRNLRENLTAGYLNGKDNGAKRASYDKIIRCLGFVFDFDVFGNATDVTDKFPPINPNYEMVTTKGVFVAGAASHSLDYRKSAGGFIHGFRYTARALSRLLAWRYEGEPWPRPHPHSLPLTRLLSMLLKRMNEASGLYQMFQVLADVVVLSEDNKTFDYYEEFPIELLHAFPNHTGQPVPSGLLILVMQYGPEFSGPGKDTMGNGRVHINPASGHLCNFLHPVLYYYSALPTEDEMRNRSKEDAGMPPRPTAVHHVVEDFLTSWDAFMMHHNPLRRFLENVLSTDLRLRFASSCFRQAMTLGLPSPSCSGQLRKGQGLTLTPEMSELIPVKEIPSMGNL